MAVAVVGIGTLALGLRLWAIGFAWGLPRGRPDEEIYLLPALQRFGSAGSHGLLARGCTEGFALILHLLLRGYARALAWWYGQEVNLGCLFALDPTRVLLVGRVLSATAGTLTLIPTAFIARRLVEPSDATRAALTAALLLAVNYLHGRDSHFGVPDASLAFALTWTVWALVRFNEDGLARHALLAALFAGLAIAVKWTALFVVPVLGGSLLYALWRRRREGHGAGAGVVLVLAVVATVCATFLVLDPSVLLEPTETSHGLFGHGMRYQEDLASHTQDPRLDLGYGIVFHSLVTMPIACGWLALAAAFFGLAYTLRRRPAAAWTCLFFLAFLYGLGLGPTRMLWVRYCVPVVPIVLALAAAGLIAASRLLVLAGSRPVFRTLLLIGLVVVTAALPAARLITIDRLLARADTRELAARWMREHTPEGATLAPEVAYTNVYGIDDTVIDACLPALPEALRTRPVLLPRWTKDWRREVAAGRAGWGAIAEYALDYYWGANPGMNPDYISRGFALLKCGERAPHQYVSPVPPNCLEEVASFHPGAPSCDVVLDLFDQFFVPYADFRGVERPGPEVVVYRYLCKGSTT